MRYADMIVDRRRNRLICVREDHTVAGREAVNTIATVDLHGDEYGQTLTAGADFYAAPRLDPDGAYLAWLTWNHPNMPWDGTELWVAAVRADGSLGEAELVAGGPGESIVQPEWSPDGVLHFASDRSGWWNLYRRREGGIEALCPMEAEFSPPPWIFGVSLFGFASARQIICAYRQGGYSYLASLDTDTGATEPIKTPYRAIAQVRVEGSTAAFVGGSPRSSSMIVRLDLRTREASTLSRASTVEVDPAYLSIPRAVEFPTENGRTAHAFFYAPHNPHFSGGKDERPPLLVMIHGGPTAATDSTLNLAKQFWTSRGIAVLDVNYGGSTGYGRAYRDRLKGQWGVVDVDDCVNGARYLVERGEVDGKRLAITGGSAGGYTTLCALTFRHVFGAGASHFGVSDAEAFVGETHKFESRYLDQLIGPFPQQRELYRERSPVNFVDRLRTPVIFFQGLDDPIVLPSQTEVMVEALRKNGTPVAYVPFAGEQHGFRRAENAKRALDAELYFYSRIFGFALADPIEPVAIDNLA